jgi:hypothetical protein
MKRHWLILGVIAVTAYAAAALAETNDIPRQLAELLDGATKVPPDSFLAAQAQYESLNQAAPTDFRVEYTMALVAVQRHYLTEAASYLDKITTDSQLDRSIRRLKALVHLVRGEQTAAQSGMRDLAVSLRSDSSAGANDAAKWLGEVVGYYAGPGADKITVADLTALESDLKAKLPDALALSFNSGKLATADLFQQLQKDQAAARIEAKAKLADKRQHDQDQNDKALAEITQKREAAEKAVADYQQQNNGKVGSDNQINRLKQDVVRQQQMEGSLNPQTRLRATQKLNQDQQQLQQLGGGTGANSGKLSSLQAEVAKLKKTEQALTAKKAELEKRLSTNTPTSLDGKLDAVLTYAGIDLEQEKQSILASYK